MSLLSLSVVVVGILTSRGCSPNRLAVGLMAGELWAEVTGREKGVEPDEPLAELAELFRWLLEIDIVGWRPDCPR